MHLDSFADAFAADDHLTPTWALEACQQAHEPKKLALLQATKDFDAASGAARDWFREALGSSR
jgi:hypothetical protein